MGIVLAIVLMVFGPKRLPELGKTVGKGIREFRGSISGEEEARPAVADPATRPARPVEK